MARNEADVRDFEAKMAEQERRTADLIGGVFSNLSGVLSEAVRKGATLNEAQVAEQKKQMAEIEVKVGEQDRKMGELMKTMEAMLAGQNEKTLQQDRKIASQ